MKNHIKTILKVLSYLIGGSIFGALFITAIIAVIIILTIILTWLGTFNVFQTVGLFLSYTAEILVGLLILIVGIILFDGFAQWIKSKIHKK